MDYIIGRRQVEPGSARLKADEEQIAFARLERRYAIRPCLRGHGTVNVLMTHATRSHPRDQRGAIGSASKPMRVSSFSQSWHNMVREAVNSSECVSALVMHLVSGPDTRRLLWLCYYTATDVSPADLVSLDFCAGAADTSPITRPAAA
jgi:hypothetical protein